MSTRVGTVTVEHQITVRPDPFGKGGFQADIEGMPLSGTGRTPHEAVEALRDHPEFDGVTSTGGEVNLRIDFDMLELAKHE